jgi:hypothetical protein
MFVLVLLVLAASLLFAVEDARNQKLIGSHVPIYGTPIRVDYTHSFSPMEIDSTPPFPEYHGLPLYIAGDTYYDMQHNSTKGRNIAVDPDGGVHVCWMDATSPTHTNRRTKYSYFHIDSVTGGDPSTGWVCPFDGAQVDGGDYSGYATIAVDDEHTVPTVAYHDHMGSANNKSNASFDGMYYASAYTRRCVFITPYSGPDPYYVHEDPTFDCVALWPVIAQIDTTVWMVSTCSNSADTIPTTGEPCGDRLIYYRGFIKPDIVSITNLIFEDPIEIEDDQNGITGDLTAWENPTGGNNKVAMGYIRLDTTIVNDTCYCDIANYYTTTLDAAAINIRRSTDMGETWSAADPITEAMAHIYSDYPESIYVGYSIDSTATPPETVEVWRAAYIRPVDLNVVYSPSGVLHAVWGGIVLAPREGWENVCAAACSVGAYRMECLYHWDEVSDVIDTVTWWNNWLFYPPSDRRPTDPFRSSQMGPSHEPTVAVDEDENIFVFWEQRWSEYWWADAGTLFVDNSLLTFPNSEIYCSVYNPDSGYWSDPLNITNTNSPSCSTGSCQSEIEVTVAERIDDCVHLFFILDKDAGLKPYPFGTAEGEGEVTLGDVCYLRLPHAGLLESAYSQRQIVGGIYEEKFEVNKPATFRLGRNYPNPFNAATSVWFAANDFGHYTVDIIDVTGRVVSTLIDRDLQPGRVRLVWDSYTDSGWNVPSGVYFLRARDDNGNWATRKITLVK